MAVPPAAGGDLKSRVLFTLKDRQLLHGTMELCRFDGPNDKNVVVVTLQTDRKMYRDRLASTVLQQELARAISDAAGKPVQVEWRLPDITVSADGTTAPPPKVDPGPTTKRVLGAFRGRVVQVNPEDRVKDEAKPERRDDDGAPVDEQPPDPVE